MNLAKTIFFILLITITNINAQWSFGILTEHQYNNNPFQSPLPIESLVSSYDFTIENTINNFNLSYYGSFININKLPERNFYWHQFAISNSDSNYVYGLIFNQRIGKVIYTYFDFKDLVLFYSTDFENDFFNFNINPIFNYTKYDEISILDNIKFSLNYKLIKGFESGTTFFLGGSFIYKKYLTPVQSGYFTYTDSNNVIHNEFYVDKNINSLFNISTYFRVAQSLTETSGLAIQYMNRSIFNKISDSNKELNVIWGDESEIFDDPTNIQGNNYLIEFTKILWEDWQFKFGYYYYKKFYPTQGNYDSLGNYFTDKQRSDKQTTLGISINKSFNFDFLGDKNLDVSINFQNIKNQSSSYWFNYNNTTFGINFGLSL